MTESSHKGLSCLDDYKEFAPTVLRVFLGIVFLSAAYAKIFVFTAQGFAQGLSFMPFPLFFAWLVILTEGIGGLFLILGLWVRWSSIPLLIVMMVAFSRDVSGGWMKGWLTLWGIGMLLALILLGSGKCSLEKAAFGKEC